MRFLEWIKQSGLSHAEVGRRLGLSRGNISDLVIHRWWPTRAVLLRIYELTDGAVTPNDFFESPPPKIHHKKDRSRLTSDVKLCNQKTTAKGRT